MVQFKVQWLQYPIVPDHRQYSQYWHGMCSRYSTILIIIIILTQNIFNIQDVLVLTFFFNKRSDLKVLSSAFNWPHTYPSVEEKSPKRLDRFITLTSPCSETVIGSPCHILWAKFWWEHRKQGEKQQIYKSLSFLQKGKKKYKPLFVFSWQNSVLQVKERRSWWAIHHLFSANQKKPIIRESCTSWLFPEGRSNLRLLNRKDADMRSCQVHPIQL